MTAMTTYAAFLRGINLGPTNKIAMPALRQLAEGLGYGNVTTYINSGNLIFTSGKQPETLAREISAALRGALPKPVDVAVRSRAELEKIVADNPYPEGDPSRVAVAFLMQPAAAGAAEKLAAVAADHEPFTVGDREVYVHYSQGLGTSRMAEQFARIIGGSATTRNIRTVEKVLALMP